MVSDPKLFDHVAACELAEKRAIAVYGAVFARELGVLGVDSAHRSAANVAALVPRPEPYRVPTALERQLAAGQVNAVGGAR